VRRGIKWTQTKVVDPNDPRYATTCDGHPTAEQMEESARRQRESTALSVWDVDAERELLIREAAEWAKRELLRKKPWLRNESWMQPD
jgi:hypothetical protein